MLVDKLTDSNESQFITKLKEAAAKREEELNPKSEISEPQEEIVKEAEAPDENQISILEMRRDDTQNPEEINVTEATDDVGLEN